MKDCGVTLPGSDSSLQIYPAVEGDCPVGVLIMN